MKIAFPILNISEDSWEEEYLVDYLLFDEYIYTDKQEYFDTYLKRKLFCDCRGDIYCIVAKVPPEAWWRKTFRFLFLLNVYKVKLTFQKTGQHMKLEELRTYMITRIKEFGRNERDKKWIEYLESAKDYEEFMIGPSE